MLWFCGPNKFFLGWREWNASTVQILCSYWITGRQLLGLCTCSKDVLIINITTVFYVYGSVHRWSILIIAQRDATQNSLFIILQVHSTCFGCQPHPSSGVHKTVTTASDTGYIFCAATSLQRGHANVATLAQKIWPVPEAVVIALCTPDDGCGLHSKHVEWTCRIINRLFVLHLVGQLLIYNNNHYLMIIMIIAWLWRYNQFAEVPSSEFLIIIIIIIIIIISLL